MRAPFRLSVGILLAFTSGNAFAQGEIEADEEILVIGTAPVLGLGVDRDKIPANVRVFGGEDMRRGGGSNFLRTLDEGAGGLSLMHAQNNPFQPSITYRGP